MHDQLASPKPAKTIANKKRKGERSPGEGRKICRKVNHGRTVVKRECRHPVDAFSHSSRHTWFLFFHERRGIGKTFVRSFVRPSVRSLARTVVVDREPVKNRFPVTRAGVLERSRSHPAGSRGFLVPSGRTSLAACARPPIQYKYPAQLSRTASIVFRPPI